MSDECPFCSIESARFMAERSLAVLVWDSYSVSPGHALVIPRRHFDDWFEVTTEELADCAELVKVAKTLIEASHSPDGYNVGVNIGGAAGQTVVHAHLHVIPRYLGDVGDPAGGIRHVIPEKANYLNLQEEPQAYTVAEPEVDQGRPRTLITGAPENPLLPQLVDALDRAMHVDIVAAFVLQSGVNLLREHLRDVIDRKGHIRILTGDYFSVTEPAALRTLLDLGSNIEVRAYETKESSFHPKAYVVSEDETRGVAFVGSSNLRNLCKRHAIGIEFGGQEFQA